MIFPSNILAIFSHKGGTQSPDDSQVGVPHVLQPIAEIPQPVIFHRTSFVAAPGTPNSLNDSFIISAENTVTNAGGAVVGALGRLLQGLWDLEFAITYWSNVTDLSVNAFLSLQDVASGNAAYIWSSYTPVAVLVSQRVHLRLAVQDAQGKDIIVSLDNTAALKSHGLNVFVSGNRLG